MSPLWTIVPDGSLRNGGVEFITTGGLGGERLATAINQLQAALEVVNYDASWRCSTHMHVNMLDFTVNQVVRFLLVYTACEPVMFEFCGAYRKSSNFCTPVLDSLPFHRKIISRMWDDAVSRRWPMQHCNKYVALNLLPLFPDQRNGRALGTVEFRGGRPLVSREEMFKQANLLLSIKDYVRNFIGTEEELLSSLTAGVHNTVFANGVSAGIEPSIDNLERSLIASWMLLKSYQEGMTASAAHRAQQEQVEAHMARLNSNNPFVDSPRPTRRALTIASHLANPSDRDPESLDDLRFWINQADWPSMHEYYNSLSSEDTYTQLSAAYMVLRARQSSARIPSWNNAQTAMLHWAGNLTPRSAEQTPIPTMLRLRHSMIANDRHEEPRGNLPGIPVQGNRPARICYQQILGPERWAELLRRIGYGSDARNIDIWHYLVNHRVRTKGRDTLNNAIHQWTNQLEVTGHISTFALWNTLRMARLPSADHVWSADLPAYDNFCYILSILKEAEVQIPYLVPNPLSFSTAKMMWTRVQSAMGAEVSINRFNATNEGRTVARTMTGIDIY